MTVKDDEILDKIAEIVKAIHERKKEIDSNNELNQVKNSELALHVASIYGNRTLMDLEAIKQREETKLLLNNSNYELRFLEIVSLLEKRTV